jgi:hypothetical protein
MLFISALMLATAIVSQPMIELDLSEEEISLLQEIDLIHLDEDLGFENSIEDE